MNAENSSKIVSVFSPIVFKVMQVSNGREEVIDVMVCKSVKQAVLMVHMWFKEAGRPGIRFQFSVHDDSKPVSEDAAFFLHPAFLRDGNLNLLKMLKALTPQ